MAIFKNVYSAIELQAQKIIELHDYIEILWRRKSLFIISLVLGVILASVYSFTLPPLYQSSSLIVVEAQQVPQEYVRSAVPASISERMSTLTQQILSRKNLVKIIRQFGLHRVPSEGASGGLMNALKEKAKAILTMVGLRVSQDVARPSPHAMPERVITNFRNKIVVKAVGTRSRKRRGNEAISVAYSGQDPHSVMQITNALTLLFVEENLRSRGEAVEGTTAFLNSQLQLAKDELERQEKLLKEFKEQHMGALPEQLDANISKLDRLQVEIKSVNESLLKAEEKKILYERELREAMTLPGGGITAVKPVPELRQVRLKALRRELARLLAQYTESYPDVSVLRGQIQELESDLRARPTTQVTAVAAPTSNPQLEIVQAQIHGQLQLVERGIAELQAQLKRIQGTSQRYDERIEQTFENEAKLADLTRDFQSTHQNYQELLQKRMSAKLSEDLEKRQQGERFQILDPAYLPLVPYKPNRTEIIFLGTVLGGAIGVGLAFLLDYLGSSGFRKPEELQDAFSLPLLGSIPSNESSRRDHVLVSMEEPDSIVSEQFRILYTKIDNARREKSHKIFAISSAVENEGKTISTLNLSVIIARDFGKKIMLLEGDFKRPSILPYLKTTMQGGLVDVLMDTPDGPGTLVPMADSMLPFAHENLSILPAVKSIRNSSNLLSSRRMKGLLEILKSQYDFILIDAPPVLPLSDMNLFREVVDGIILVVRAESTPKRAVQQTMEMLGTDKIVGLILNDVQQKFQPYYQYYSNYGTSTTA